MAKEKENIYGYKSQADKARDKTLSSIQGMVFVLLILFVVNICFSVMNVWMLSHQQGAVAAVEDEWIEVVTANNIGYKVKKTWSTSGIENAVVFQPTDTTAITVQADNLESLNATNELKCTSDNLLEYLQENFTTLQSVDGLSISDVSYREYKILDTTGYYMTFTQIQTVEGVKVAGYSDSLFFVYDSYLYSFSYASSFKGATSTDFETVLKSIRVAPEQEDNMTSLTIGGTSVNESLIDDFTSLLPNELTSSDGTTTSE